MSNCSICKDPVPAHGKPIKNHLVMTQDKEGHIHTHGDLSRPDAMREMLSVASEACGATLAQGANLPREIVFHNKQRVGDSLMFTCAIRDFKRAFPHVKVGVIMTAEHIVDHNPHIDRSIPAHLWHHNVKKIVKALPPDEQDKQKRFPMGDGQLFQMIGPTRLTNQTNSKDWHFANAYRYSMEAALGVNIPQGESRPDIYFTQEEYDSPRPYPFPYWVICTTGERGWGCKMFPVDRWQAFVEQNPDIHFVQIGTTKDNPPRLKGANIIDIVGKTDDGKTGIRDLFKLFLHAEGSIGLVSFHMHLSGALYKPAVIIAGAREPVSFTRYAGHQYLANDGTLPCATTACWHCKIEKCTNRVQYPDKYEKEVPKCVDMISAEDVTRALRQYYIGGRLTIDKPCAKPAIRKRPQDLGINVVPTPVIVQEPSVGGGGEAKNPNELEWGRGAIDPLDWPFMEDIIKKHKVATVLEFGAGLSTKMMAENMGLLVDSFETEQVWLDKIRKAAPNAHIRKWDGKEISGPIRDQYDMAFVDGPANGQNREQAVRIAANHARIVILHDATREYESQWEAKYLAPGFSGPLKGGRWCHMWMKTPSFVAFSAPPQPPSNPSKKRIRIVSTARGWGGCARSITTIMKMLLKEGHDVEFVPFRNKVTSREMLDALKNGLSAVQVSESYDALREDCDVLLVYADDYIWEFGQPHIVESFENLKADRMIMMLNYRRGGVGEIPWTRGFDKYLFLNSGQERELLKHLPDAKTGVYPPCTDLRPFFEVKPDYSKPLTIVRHNSQGDTKFDKDNTAIEVANALAARPELNIHMLPGPTWMPKGERFHKHGRTGIPEQIADFLAQGNLFWYSLPKGYLDMGPRVILEAMAAGLPVIADNWGGAPDRVTPDCGWICDSKEQMLEIIKTVTPEELKRKGENARARALAEFRPERWIEELTGEPICR